MIDGIVIDLNAELIGGRLQILGYVRMGKLDLQYQTSHLFNDMMMWQKPDKLVNDIVQNMHKKLDETLTKCINDAKEKAIKTIIDETYNIFGTPHKDRKYATHESAD